MATKENYWSTPEKVNGYIAEIKDEFHIYTDYFIEMLNQLAAKGNHINKDFVVDLGCGPGMITNIFIEMFGFKRLHAVDISEAMLNAVPWYVDLEKTKTSMQCADLNDRVLNLTDSVVDLVISLSSFNYLFSYTVLLKESFRVLKTDGIILFDVSLHHENTSEVKSCKNGWPMTGYAYSFDSFIGMVKECGFTILTQNLLGPSFNFSGAVGFHYIFALKKQ